VRTTSRLLVMIKICAVLAICLGSLGLSQTLAAGDDGTKLYQDPVYGFSVRVPASWQQTMYSGLLKQRTGGPRFWFKAPGTEFIFNCFGNSTGFLDKNLDYLRRKLQQVEPVDFHMIKEEAMDIGGAKGWLFEWEGGQKYAEGAGPDKHEVVHPRRGKQFMTQKGDVYLQIDFVDWQPENYDSIVPLIDAAVKTFAWQ
jgi:hypothetical protein